MRNHGRKHSRRVKDKYEPNLELCVDNVTEVSMKQEDRSYLDNLMREFTTMDDDLIEQPCCKLIDDYPYHLIERCEEEVKMVESIALLLESGPKPSASLK